MKIGVITKLDEKYNIIQSFIVFIRVTNFTIKMERESHLSDGPTKDDLLSHMWLHSSVG